MPGRPSPSPVLSHFVRELERILPGSDRARLGEYSDAVGATTHHGDLRRAFFCADWAVHMAERRSDSRFGRMVEGLKESQAIWRDSLYGAHFGFAVADGIGPGQDMEIQWVEAAIAVACAEAERSGWDAVPWEELMKKLLEVEPPERVLKDAARPPGTPDVTK